MTSQETGQTCQECQNIRNDLGVTEEEMTARSSRKLTKTGKVLLGVFGASFVTVSAVCVPFLLPALRKVCLPYVPATTQQVSNVMKLLHGRTGAVVDLGSGDGRIVIEAAKRGFKAVGIELNPWLVWYSRLQALRHGVYSNAKFKTQDLWKSMKIALPVKRMTYFTPMSNNQEVDLTVYNNVVIFGVEQMMPQLESKLVQELKDSGCVIACRFALPTWKPEQSLDAGIDTVWLYKQASR